MSRYDHIDFTPPEGAREAAKRALEVRAEKPASERGMTPTGIARARDLISGKALSPETVRRMLAFFQRHEVDKDGATWGEQGKGWQAWNGWGGDAGYAWARKVVRQMDAADEKDMSDEHTVTASDGPSRSIRCEGRSLADALPEVGHTTWNQIARRGTYLGHPQGEFTFDDTTFAQIVANFGATENGRVPVDYEHTSEVLPENVAQRGVPAVAWITAVEDRGDAGLWAAFEWVDADAVEHVRAKRYLYVSPAVNFDAIDRVSGQSIGARLTSVALTNHPFLDGMRALVASTTAETQRMGLAPDAVHTPAGVEIAPRKETPTMNEDTEIGAMKAKYDALKSKVAKMAAMDPEAAEDEALDAIQKKIDALQQIQKQEAEMMADQVCASGRAPASAKADLVALCLSSREQFVRIFPAQVEKPAQVDADARTLLTGRVASAANHAPAPSPEIDADDPLAESRAVNALAQKMMSDGRAKTLTAAITLAAREVHTARVNDALARLPR